LRFIRRLFALKWRTITTLLRYTSTKTASSTAPEEDGIPNRIVKLVLPHIMSVVKWIFNQSLRLEYCLKHFKEFITMFLRKINRSNYFVFKAYRSIALLNTLNKIMKSIMTIRLSYVAEKCYEPSRNKNIPLWSNSHSMKRSHQWSSHQWSKHQWLRSVQSRMIISDLTSQSKWIINDQNISDRNINDRVISDLKTTSI
jgi:hypothetical protein